MAATSTSRAITPNFSRSSSRRAWRVSPRRSMAWVRSITSTEIRCANAESPAFLLLLLAVDHPGRAVLIDQHAEALSPEGLGDGHHHLGITLRQFGEDAVGFLWIVDAQRHRKSLRLVEALFRRIGAHQHLVAHDHARMHDQIAVFCGRL